jgi:hypothetical protein
MISDLTERKRQYCLRCKTVVLDILPSPEEITFYECGQCRRQFAHSPGKSLCFRWLHPISLVLYPVIFSTSPTAEAPRVAAMLAEQRTPEEFDRFLREIHLELDEPTQQIRDIFDCRASEDQLRRYLSTVVEFMEKIGPLRR